MSSFWARHPNPGDYMCNRLKCLLKFCFVTFMFDKQYPQEETAGTRSHLKGTEEILSNRVQEWTVTLTRLISQLKQEGLIRSPFFLFCLNPRPSIR